MVVGVRVAVVVVVVMVCSFVWRGLPDLRRGQCPGLRAYRLAVSRPVEAFDGGGSLGRPEWRGGWVFRFKAFVLTRDVSAGARVFVLAIYAFVPRWEMRCQGWCRD